MTIGKKLYFGFGAILAIMLVLFFINVITVRREYAAQATVKATLADEAGHRRRPLANDGKPACRWAITC